MEDTGLTVEGYAGHRKRLGLPGATRYAVQKALRDGRISRNRYNRIDPGAADRDWILNTDPGKAPEPPPAEENGDGLDDLAGVTFQEARRREAVANAALKELDLRRRRGELVEVEAVKRDTFALFRAVRERLQAVPGRVAAEAVGLDTPKAVERVFLREIRAAFEELARKVPEP